jgi:ketosteroid isomerase-like protein
MSQENIAEFRRTIDAYNRGDLEGFVEGFDPSVEWRALTGVMFGTEATVYRGHEGIRGFWRDIDEAFAEAQIEYLDARDLGERIVVVARLRIRGKASGVETESPLAWVVDFTNGRVSRMRDYVDPQQALEAAGVEE